MFGPGISLKESATSGTIGTAPVFSVLAKRYFRSENGSLTVFTLFIFICMFMVAGLAVDIMRYETARIKTQSTLDRAILAAADLEQSLTGEEVVDAYFAAAGLSELIVETTVDEGLNYKTVSATTSTRVNSLFMHTMGINSMVAPSGGIAEERVSNVEISLVLDVSGSMWGEMDELKDAAELFIDTVMPAPELDDEGNPIEDEYLTHISIIPYNHQTNAIQIGSLMNFTDEHTHSYCANWSDADFREADPYAYGDIPQSAHFDYSDYKGNNSRWLAECRHYSYNQITPFISDNATAKAFVNTLYASGYTSIDIGAKWGVALLDPGLQPVVDALIDDETLTADFEGRPFDYNGKSLKVMILMTDGDNTTQYEIADGYYQDTPSYLWKDNDENTLIVDLESFFGTSISNSSYRWWVQDSSEYYGGYFTNQSGLPSDIAQLNWPQVWEWGGLHYIQDEVMDRLYKRAWKTGLNKTTRRKARNWMNYMYESYGTTAKNARLKDICDVANDPINNIRIYSIGLDTSDQYGVLAHCATEPSFYFAADADTIDETFASIATQINQLKLIE